MSEPKPTEEPLQAQQSAEQQDPLASLQVQLNECQDKYLRLLAESENVRKRLLKERQELMQYAVENLLSEFLHPIDNFENALKFATRASDEVRNWAAGFQMIAAQFKQVLSNHGLEEFSSIGQQFDPLFHEAVEMVETTDHSPGTVIEQSVSGYKKGERTVRVARVKVAKAPPEKKLDTSQEGV
ncbi:MAG: nucleotide exchange factor GrpE [Verrucomicrobia bacterium]|nr:nucleotide exchange factor GrpE [Verrucomicrobiota bacterium]MBS0645255.1 nucleotide exchange factor GrpE [Verrucomicrobiota bacterium]